MVSLRETLVDGLIKDIGLIPAGLVFKNWLALAEWKLKTRIEETKIMINKSPYFRAPILSLCCLFI